MPEEENVMEFMGDSNPIQLGSDLTTMESGNHNIPMNFGEGITSVPVSVVRGLDVLTVSYTHNNHEYTHVLHTDGRKYSHVDFLGDESGPPRSWQEKGMWRYY